MNDIPLVKDNGINAINTSLIAAKKSLQLIYSILDNVNKTFKDINKEIDAIDAKFTDYLLKDDVVNSITDNDMRPVTSNAVAQIAPVDTVASGNLHSVTSNGVFNALRPIANTVNQYIEKGDDVASIDTSNNTGYRLNKVTLNQYYIHLEPARFVAKENPPQSYIRVFKVGNALLQVFSESRNIAFNTENIFAIWDETIGTYAIADCYVDMSNKTFIIRNIFSFNQNFNLIEGHSYVLLGDITFCVF